LKVIIQSDAVLQGAWVFCKKPNSAIERSIEFVIKVGAGTEAVGLFESIHLFK
jgi:hypothetical protein